MKLLVAVLCILAANAGADDASTQAKRAQLEAERAARLENRACPVEQHVARTVDLDRPGAFTELKDANPAHFARLLDIQETRPRPIKEVWTWMHTHAKACDVTMLNFYRTSLPAQAVLSFVLDDTRYTRTVYVGQGR